MKPLPGLDPPEYLHWQEDPALVREFDDRALADSDRADLVRALPREQRLRVYEGLVRNRLHDIQLKRWVRSGVLSKAWLGPGEEAVTVGACHALGRQDAVGPMIRNIGACHERGMPLVDMFRGALGAADGPTGGRDLHFGDLERGIVAPISMVGSLVPVMAGMALAFRLRGERRAALTWVGDGAVATAGFHEGMSTAAALSVPLVVVIQNNRIALGTPLPRQRDDQLRRYGDFWGRPTLAADGNNVLDVWAAVKLARRRALASGPAIVVADTCRMGGHATHDEDQTRKLLPAALLAHYGRRDPVRLYRAWLARGGAAQPAVPAADLDAVEERVSEEVRAAERTALRAHRDAPLNPAGARDGVFAG